MPWPWDNLLETRSRGAKQNRVDDATDPLAKLIACILVFVLVLLGGLHRIWRNDLRHRLDAEPPSQSKVRVAWRFAGLYLRFVLWDALLILLAVIVAVWLRLPINWIAVTAVVLGHGLWSLREVIGEDLGPICEHAGLAGVVRWVRQRMSLRHEVLHPPERARAARNPPHTR